MKFTTRVRYRFGDIDDAGIAYYPTFFHYFHCAFEDWWSDALHRPYDQVLHHDKFGLPAVHAECDYFRPVRYGDSPDVHLGILRLGNTSVEFGYWMTRGDEAGPLCRARVVTVGVDMDTMEKRSLPERYRQAFTAFLLAPDEYPPGPRQDPPAAES